jgi:ComF family protein
MLYLDNFADLLFPRICAGCNDSLATNESLICSACLYQLPRTGYCREEDNPVARMFWGRVYLQNACSFLYFQKGGRLQSIIHHLKYKGQKEIGVMLGKMFASEMSGTPYVSVDLIVPVPLHKTKYRKRGYNQSEFICKGISEIFNKEINTTSLKRVVSTSTQTHKQKYERWENVKDIFKVADPQSFENKHILLVDDVLTTGATLEACAMALNEVPGIKISVATLAFAVL